MKVSTKSGFLALGITVFVTVSVGALGLLAGSKYESSCTTDPTSRQQTCTSSYKYGLSIDLASLQTLAGAVGTGAGIFVLVKSGRLSQALESLTGNDQN